MKTLFGFLVNLPWTVIGFLMALSCSPMKIQFENKQLAIVILVRKLWFLSPIFYGWTCGHIVVIKDGMQNVEKIKRHELIHVEQFDRFWGLFPFLYAAEMLLELVRILMLSAYHENRFEKEAYFRSENEQK